MNEMIRSVRLVATVLALTATALSHSPIAAQPDREGRTPLEYARECEEHLGPLPRFTCSDALEIPITVDGHRIPVTPENVGTTLERCDNPAAFGDGCQIGNRVGRYDGRRVDGSPNPDVTFVTFCRDGGMGVIGHHQKTGATCFFSIEEGASASGEVPGPADAGYDRAWQTPEVVARDGCTNCHMADPFLHTPWIDQVPNPHARGAIVPLSASADTPYFVVGKEFSQPPGRVGDGDVPSVPEALAGNSCVECHRPQCVPAFFNVALDELTMPAPFHRAVVDPDAESAADRERLSAWCESLQIRYFSE